MVCKIELEAKFKLWRQGGGGKKNQLVIYIGNLQFTLWGKGRQNSYRSIPTPTPPPYLNGMALNWLWPSDAFRIMNLYIKLNELENYLS